MGAKTSPAMHVALALIKGGATAYSAAKQTGLALSTVYRSKLYKELVADRKNQLRGEK